MSGKPRRGSTRQQGAQLRRKRQEGEHGGQGVPQPVRKRAKVAAPPPRRAAGRGPKPQRPATSPLSEVVVLTPFFEQLAKRDGLRSLPLVAQDIASCVQALGLRASDPIAAELWAKLAEGLPPPPPPRPAPLVRDLLAVLQPGAAQLGGAPGEEAPAALGQQGEQHQQEQEQEGPLGGQAVGEGEGEAGQQEEVGAAGPGEQQAEGQLEQPPSPLDVVKQAVACDRASCELLTRTEARRRFRLSPKDFEGMPTHLAVYRRHQYLLKDVQKAALRGYGSEEGLLAAKRKAQERGEKARRTRMAKIEQRRQSLVARCEAEGISLTILQRSHFSWMADGYARRGGSCEELMAALREAAAEHAAQQQRRADARARLAQHGLDDRYLLTDSMLRVWVEMGQGDPAARVAELAVQQRRQQRVAARRRALNEALRDAGLSHLFLRPECSAFVHKPPPEDEALALAGGLLGPPVGEQQEQQQQQQQQEQQQQEQQQEEQQQEQQEQEEGPEGTLGAEGDQAPELPAAAPVAAVGGPAAEAGQEEAVPAAGAGQGERKLAGPPGEEAPRQQATAEAPAGGEESDYQEAMEEQEEEVEGGGGQAEGQVEGREGGGVQVAAQQAAAVAADAAVADAAVGEGVAAGEEGEGAEAPDAGHQAGQQAAAEAGAAGGQAAAAAPDPALLAEVAELVASLQEKVAEQAQRAHELVNSLAAAGILAEVLMDQGRSPATAAFLEGHGDIDPALSELRALSYGQLDHFGGPMLLDDPGWSSGDEEGLGLGGPLAGMEAMGGLWNPLFPEGPLHFEHFEQSDEEEDFDNEFDIW